MQKYKYKLIISFIWLCIAIIVITFSVYRYNKKEKLSIKNEVEIIYDGSENNPIIEGVQ